VLGFPRLENGGGVAVLDDPDHEINVVIRAQNADETAFAELYTRHARYVAGVVYRLMGNDADLDDVVQETFVDAADGISSLKEPKALRGWLVAIAVRRVHRVLARRRRRTLFGFQMMEVAARSSDPNDRSRVDDLYEALDDIPPDLRVPWTLHRVEQMSLPETAEACGVSLATVKRRIAEAQERIERRLEK
jgi:RNA polymerase sigma-70 factor (ECF subfamily)